VRWMRGEDHHPKMSRLRGEGSAMPHIRVSKKTYAKIHALAKKLVGAPGIETAKHAGAEYVPADQVVTRALAALESELERKEVKK
jgi:hypothetical protein